ncbi:hypothetical protein GJ496_003531 [Pomphorhynchus laevis]|nr:hypothetical protein GJ496_003531 [Pomphorhynchus laevis]
MLHRYFVICIPLREVAPPNNFELYMLNKICSMFSSGKKSFPDPEIPVWVDGRKKWITGISKRTTFDDIVFALLRHQLMTIPANNGSSNGSTNSFFSSNRSHTLVTQTNDQQQQLHDRVCQYNIVEVRDEIERPIKGNAKVMKVWRAWSSSKARITLFLRKTEQNGSLLNTQPQHDFHGVSFFQRLLSRKSSAGRRHQAINNIPPSKTSSLPYHQATNNVFNESPNKNDSLNQFDSSPLSLASPFNRNKYTARHPIESILAKDKLVTSQLGKIHELEDQIRHLEDQMLSSQQHNRLAVANNTSSNDNIEFVISIFPTLSINKLDQFNNLSQLYYQLSDRLSIGQKTNEDLEQLLKVELKNLHANTEDSVNRQNSKSPLVYNWLATNSVEQSSCIVNRNCGGDSINNLVRNDIHASRELTRIQCKEIHDLELNMRDLENYIESKRNDLNKLESMLLYKVLDNQMVLTNEGLGDGTHESDDDKMLVVSDPLIASQLQVSDQHPRESNFRCMQSTNIVNSWNQQEINQFSDLLPSRLSGDAGNLTVNSKLNKLSKTLVCSATGDTDSGINSMTSEEHQNQTNSYQKTIKDKSEHCIQQVKHQHVAALETLV